MHHTPGSHRSARPPCNPSFSAPFGPEERNPVDPTQPTPSDGSIDLIGLVDRAREGDESAWVALVRTMGPRVFALAKSRLASTEAAEEVTQSVFATVAIKVRDGAYDEKGRFESWLFRIAMNRVRDRVRAARRENADTRLRLVARAEEADTPAASAELPADLDALRSALQTLPGPDREIVELRYHAGMSFKAMADLLAEPIGTLLARHHRALRKLRKALEPDDAAADRHAETPPTLGRQQA